MRWKPKPLRELLDVWQIFALVPHYCSDTREYVWLEKIWRRLESYYDDGADFYSYWSSKPK